MVADTIGLPEVGWAPHAYMLEPEADASLLANTRKTALGNAIG